MWFIKFIISGNKWKYVINLFFSFEVLIKSNENAKELPLMWFDKFIIFESKWKYVDNLFVSFEVLMVFNIRGYRFNLSPR